MTSFKEGDAIAFYPSPRSTDMISGEVVGFAPGTRGDFLITKDAEGKERKVRPARCKAA